MSKFLYRIRCHMAAVVTAKDAYTAMLVDDIFEPQYSIDEVVQKLKEYLSYEEANDPYYPDCGYYNGSLAQFKYLGHRDVDIPDTIVERIISRRRDIDEYH